MAYEEAIELINEYLRRREPVDEATLREITNFYSEEAELLSWQRFSDWLGLLDDEVEYVVYSRINMRRKTGHGIPRNNPLMIDDRKSLEFRVRKFYSQFSWGEDPTSRTLYMVHNVRAFWSDVEGEVVAKSHVVMYRSRRDEVGVEVFPYFRLDTLRRRDGGWRVRRRYVIPITAVLPIESLSLIY